TSFVIARTLRRRSSISFQDDPPSSRRPTPSGSEVIEQAFIRQGIDAIAAKIMLASISDSTLKQYSHTYKLWYKYCTENKVSLYGASVSEVIQFLRQLYLNGNQLYGTFNSHRSALSLILHQDLSNNPLLKRFLKGIARKRPQTPRYNYTWDPGVVLRYLEGVEGSSSLKLLSRKAVTLLALVTGGRLQTISLIRLSNIVSSAEQIQIYITDRIKTTFASKTQPCLHIPFFPGNKSICPASTLLNYIDATEGLRQNEDYLFLTYAGKHRRATKETISRWVKCTLKEAGVDTSLFKPHSTRHSASSAAKRAGVSIEEICRTAGWSEGTATFARFYDRPLQDT
ncbi:unnamed protein product, partial [Callosobruchus maculatus]